MANFPLAAHSETISKVLSSVLPPRAYAYLSAFLPGFFFEVSICLAQPRFVQELISRSNEAANLGRYPKILIAVFLAFVIGNAFMLWVGVVHRILEFVFRLGRSLWSRLCAWFLPLLNRLVNRLSASKGWWNRRIPWIQMKIVRPAHDAAFGFEHDSIGARRLWAVLTRSLFKNHYSIDLRPDLEQDEWNALYLASSSAQITRFSDHLLMIVSHALGWSGLAAIRLAPSLMNRNYIGFNLFMIAVGMFYQWRVIRGLNDEHLFGLLRVRALLREIRKGKKIAEPAKPGPSATPLAL